ncbi:class F sortase [Saccharopolyspora sp. K220]|uniref:class F sortase n=1 Tax=Saccharopolyspora soli TaxID=2926618 RepID=UPI001F59773C|nr:class F sortase [Saccharopolyspora soli]MCI2423234.1 class F sortase [Saccharopolyspora soli]
MKVAILAVWFTLLLAVTGPTDFPAADAPAAQPVATHPAEHAAADPAEPAAGPMPGDSRPQSISIPAIRVTSTLVPLGLNADGSVEVPPIEKSMQAGWYRLGPGAGQAGPFVVLGHVDSYTDVGVFLRLRDLRRGDLINVERQDGSRANYVVDRVEEVRKDEFPTQEVYGDVARPEIRLITCGGTFDESRRSYEGNVIVFGHLTRS